MTLDFRRIKQIAIISLPILAFLVLFFVVFTLKIGFETLIKEDEEKADYINEVVLDSMSVAPSNNAIDFIAFVHNPNSKYALESFDYELISNEEILSTGESYLMPGESKPIIIKNLESVYLTAENFKLNFNNLKWEEKQKNLGKIDLVVKNVSFNRYTLGANLKLYMEAEVHNQSYYKLSNIDLAVIIKNSKNEIIAINTSTVDDLDQGKNRKFKSEWTNLTLPADYTYEITAYSNFYDSANLIKVSSTPSRDTQ